jgi:hypothetical protein
MRRSRKTDGWGTLLAVIGLCAGCAGTTGDLLVRRGSADGEVTEVDGAAAIRCTPWTDGTRLEPAEPLGTINTPYAENEPFVTPDGLQLFFASDRPGGRGGFDVYVASREAPGMPFGGVVSYAAANTDNDDGGLVLSADGLTAYISSVRPGGPGAADIWSATRADPASPFSASAFAPLTSVNNQGRDFDPTPSQDGLRLYFTADGVVAPASRADVVVAERDSPAGSFGAPSVVQGINTDESHDGNPALSADELLIVFNSNRAGGSGSTDLWYATRPHRQAPFSAPRPVPAVNTARSEGEAFLTADGCTLYFGRRVDGQADLFRARVVPGGEPR